jgi:hypothetical protein
MMLDGGRLLVFNMASHIDPALPILVSKYPLQMAQFSLRPSNNFWTTPNQPKPISTRCHGLTIQAVMVYQTCKFIHNDHYIIALIAQLYEMHF